MKTTRDIVVEAFKITVPVPVEDLYTNAFLPGVFVKLEPSK
jgi:hypothetical protein